MHYQNITKADFLNGIGVRVVLWVSGCSLECKNCHNPELWQFNSGKIFDEKAKKELFEALNKPYIKGLTLSGGHPLEDYNVEKIYDLIKEVKATFINKDIWLYTGLCWESLMKEEENIKLSKIRKNVISLCDVVVDGPYIDELRDISLAWRGSSNQRVIDVQRSLKKGKVVLWDKENK